MSDTALGTCAAPILVFSTTLQGLCVCNLCLQYELASVKEIGQGMPIPLDPWTLVKEIAQGIRDRDIPGPSLLSITKSFLHR